MEMPDFEAILKFLVLFGGFMMIIIGAGFAFKGLGKKPPVETGAADKLREVEGRLAELEERVDFTERALTDVRARSKLPPKQ